MFTYRVRVIWEAVTDMVIKADNVVDAQNRAREKASGEKAKVIRITDVKVLSVERSRDE
ncbi:MAG: hypothetical protein GTO24_17215 [candidate division Zixibacteria bacterium]|nr:hypothetical protein [candidate division Zixibacteria bacterium]